MPGSIIMNARLCAGSRTHDKPPLPTFLFRLSSELYPEWDGQKGSVLSQASIGEPLLKGECIAAGNFLRQGHRRPRSRPPLGKAAEFFDKIIPRIARPSNKIYDQKNDKNIHEQEGIENPRRADSFEWFRILTIIIHCLISANIAIPGKP
jgi:hypothetical protein